MFFFILFEGNGFDKAFRGKLENKEELEDNIGEGTTRSLDECCLQIIESII